jgi:hypothetical protein
MKNTYLGYEDIVVKNFYKISETSDFNWFFKGFEGVDGKELSDKQNETLAARYKQIFLDRIEYLDDHKTKEYYRKLIEVENVRMKLYRLQNTFNTMKDIPLENEYFEQFVQDLKTEGFKFGKPVTTEEERIVYLKLMSSKIKGFKTKLSALKLEYKSDLDPKESVKKMDLMREMTVLQEILPEQRININKDPLKLWDNYVRRAGEKAKEQKQILSKSKR